MADKSKSQGGSSSGAASRGSQSKGGSKSEAKGEEKKTTARSQTSGAKSQSQSGGGKSQTSGAKSQSQSGSKSQSSGAKSPSQSGGGKSQSQSGGGSGGRAEARSSSDFSSSSRGGQSRAQQGEPAGFDREEAIVTLNNLLIADYDAVGLYERVVQNLDNDRLKSTVESFRGDHERHIRDLTEAIRNMGGEPMTRPSLMGPIGKVVATIASTLMGNKGALQALMQGEQYTNSTYAGASITNLPDQLRELVVRNSQDEQRHLKWVTETLDNM